MQRRNGDPGYRPLPAIEQGFTLPEVMLALTFGSLITLAAAKVLPLLRQQTVDAGQHYRLEQVLRQLAFVIEKDLRRSGFCAGQCQGQPLLIGNATGEAAKSCVIVAYDLNRNGQWEKGGDAEYFGYRLRAGALEGQRGVMQCNAPGWESLLDQQQARIDSFTVSQITGGEGGSRLMLGLSGHVALREDIRSRLEWAVTIGEP